MTHERKPVTITEPVLVIVEGPDEKRFYEALCKEHDIGPCQFERASGKDDIRSSIHAFALAPGREKLRAVGVIRDGDADPAAAFASAADALSDAGWPKPAEAGAVAAGRPSTSVLIVNGNLDRLCVEAAGASDDGRSRCVDAYIACLEGAVGELKDRPKSWVHAFLAGFGKGDVRVGEGAQRGYWPLSSEVFSEIRRFLEDLVEQDGP